MRSNVSDLANIQRLVLDIQAIERNHNFPGTNDHENVVEHSFSVAMLCWRVYEDLKPEIDLEKVFKYCLAHDFLERGLKNDINTYASAEEKKLKKEREADELVKLKSEFADFASMTKVVEDYENMADVEARFVWCVDKMQAIILGDIDTWRPYERVGVTYKQFCEKGDMFVSKCPDFLKETFAELLEYSKGTFYDQPTTTKSTGDPNSH